MVMYSIFCKLGNPGWAIEVRLTKLKWKNGIMLMITRINSEKVGGGIFSL